MSGNLLDVLENVSPDIMDEILEFEEHCDSGIHPCMIIKWFLGSIQEYRAFLVKLHREHTTIRVTGNDGESKYMVVIRDGLWAVAVFI